MRDRQLFAATATYRTYVNQGIANALALPYLPGTLRMPFRRLFVERAAEVQDELVSVALADQVFARQQPSSPLILPFFTASVLQGAATREGIWAQMTRVRDHSVVFPARAGGPGPDAGTFSGFSRGPAGSKRLRDEALKLADLAGTAQQSARGALGGRCANRHRASPALLRPG